MPIEDLIHKIPDYMHDRALRYKSKEAAINYLQGRLLLMHGLQFLGINSDLSSITYSDRGKPSLPDLAFSISHSGTYAACAIVMDGELGIDIEFPGKIKLQDLKHNFTNSEWLQITEDVHSPKLFYDMWCRKEAILKSADIKLPQLHQAQVDSRQEQFLLDGKPWHLQSIHLPKADKIHAAICTSEPISNIEYVYCELDF